MYNLTSKLWALLFVIAGLFSCKSSEDGMKAEGEMAFNSALHNNNEAARISGLSSSVLDQVNAMVITYDITGGDTGNEVRFTKGDALYGQGTFVTTDKIAFPENTEITITDMELRGGENDTDDHLLALTPLTGSNLANWTAGLSPESGVDPAFFVNSLPATFTISANELMNIEFAAVDVRGNQADDFGYMSGIIHEGNIVKRTDFQITTTALDASGKWVAIPGTLTIQDADGNTLFDGYVDGDGNFVPTDADITYGHYENGFWKVGLPQDVAVRFSFNGDDGSGIDKVKYHGKADAPTFPVDVTNDNSGTNITPEANDVFDIICVNP